MKHLPLPTHDPRAWPQVGDVINYHLNQNPNSELISIQVINYDRECERVEYLKKYLSNTIYDFMTIMEWRNWWENFPITSLINADQPDITWTPAC